MFSRARLTVLCETDSIKCREVKFPICFTCIKVFVNDRDCVQFIAEIVKSS